MGMKVDAVEKLSRTQKQSIGQRRRGRDNGSGGKADGNANVRQCS
jgi:hypothetical protein